MVGTLITAFVGLMVGMIGTYAKAIQNRRAMNQQKKENEAQREWASAENAANRDFQAKQAELAADRQEEFYWSTQSPAAKVSQYQEAGINPSLMFGGQMPAPSLPSTPSTPGSSIGAPVSALPHKLDVMGQFLDSLKVAAEIKNINADTDNKDADSDLKVQQIQHSIKEMDVADMKIEDFKSQISLRAKQALSVDADLPIKAQTLSLLIEQTAVASAEKELKGAITEKEKEAAKLISEQIKNTTEDTKIRAQTYANLLLQNEKLNAEKQYWPEKAYYDYSIIMKKAQQAGTETDILELNKSMIQWLNQYEQDSAVSPEAARIFKGISSCFGGASNGLGASLVKAAIK